jgi:hypothetical protein
LWLVARRIWMRVGEVEGVLGWREVVEVGE